MHYAALDAVDLPVLASSTYVLPCPALPCLPLPHHPPLPQVRIARLLWAVARKDGEALQRDLEAARSEVMGPFSGGMASWAAGYHIT